jgi:hypothetical protein
MKKIPKSISIKPSKLSKVANKCLRLEMNLSKKIKAKPQKMATDGLIKNEE